jgi:hypothetical protein
MIEPFPAGEESPAGAALEEAALEAQAPAADPDSSVEAPSDAVTAAETDEVAPMSETEAPPSEAALPPPEAELERLDGNRAQAATDEAETVIMTPAPNGADATAIESAEDEATRVSHQSESKPEVTT